MSSKKAFLSLGSNLGDREKNLTTALEALELESIHITARSSIYEAEPQDVTDQPWFLNMVVDCEMRYFPLQLLTALQRVEREMGRVRIAATPRGPRLIDIDILYFGTITMRSRELTLPHPRMLERRFVLEPLLEIAPGLRDPVSKQPLEKYIKGLKGQAVKRI